MAVTRLAGTRSASALADRPSGFRNSSARVVVGLYQLGVRSSDDNSAVVLGLIANQSIGRIHGFGQTGGGRGTGIEPSPRTREYLGDRCGFVTPSRCPRLVGRGGLLRPRDGSPQAGEIANSVEAVQDAPNGQLLFELKGKPAEDSAGMECAIERGGSGSTKQRFQSVAKQTLSGIFLQQSSGYILILAGVKRDAVGDIIAVGEALRCQR
jgi:hypothetical protein